MGISLRLISEDGRERNNGLELAILNVTMESRGVQVGGINATNESKGVQVGLINGADESRGVQVGVGNYAEESSYGVQVGVTINYAGKLRGIQLAPFLNICGEDSKGVQLGALNWRTNSPWYSTCIPGLAIRTNRKKNSPKNNPESK